MAKLELPIIVNCTEIDELIDEIRHLQTYKLFEGDEQVLIDRDSVVAIIYRHAKVSSEEPNDFCSREVGKGDEPEMITHQEARRRIEEQRSL